MFHSVMFHHFHGKSGHIKSQGSISQGQLNSLIIELKKNYNILNPETFREKFNKNNLSSKDITLSFDDGLKCQIDLATPVLKEHGISAFFFIYTGIYDETTPLVEYYRDFRASFNDINDFYELFFNKTSSEFPELSEYKMPENYLEEYPFYSYNDKKYRYLRDNVTKEKHSKIYSLLFQDAGYFIKNQNLFMNQKEVLQLSNEGHTIGLHSHTHPTLISSLSKDIIHEEYLKNKNTLEKITNQKIWSMSHPCGKSNQDVHKCLNKLNIDLGFNSCINNEYTYQEKFIIPREDHINLIKKWNIK